MPLTSLRDDNKGGAPLYAGGDRFSGEPLPTPPAFEDDDDPYMNEHPERRALATIVHIPPPGEASVDFVSLFMRNNSTTERRYVNVLLAASLSVHLRATGLIAQPVYGDVLMVEDDSSSVAVSALINGAGELVLTVTTNDVFDALPTIELIPPPDSGALVPMVALAPTGEIMSITVQNPTVHNYTEPPRVIVRGGVHNDLGIFVDTDKQTTVSGAAAAGPLTVVGTLCRTLHPNNVTFPGDLLIVNGEARVVRSTNPQAREFTIDTALTGTSYSFAEWQYLPLLSASGTSQYRTGNGTLSANLVLGQTGLVCTTEHNLSPGDYVVYATRGVWYSHRVDIVASARQFTVDGTLALTESDDVPWFYVYLLSETQPGSVDLTPVRVLSYIKTCYAPGKAVGVLGLGARPMYIRNTNYFNAPGSYHKAILSATSPAVLVARVGSLHDTRAEVASLIESENVLEVQLKPQPAQEVQVLNSFPLNGGLAAAVGERPLIALYERGREVVSNDVVFWGYYIRYTPDEATNFVQAINI
ncbi:MAG: hypothetical protein ACO32I_06440 [Candidatus Limnocylindrus sp.]